MFDLRDQPPETRAQMKRVAARTGYPAEAVFLVFFAMSVACRDLSDDWWSPTERRVVPDDRPVRHLTAVEACDAVCRCARARAGAQAPTYFDRWGLHEGRDVGRIVYALIADGLGAAGPGDRRDQFDRVPLRRLLVPVRDSEPDTGRDIG